MNTVSFLLFEEKIFCKIFSLRHRIKIHTIAFSLLHHRHYKIYYFLYTGQLLLPAVFFQPFQSIHRNFQVLAGYIISILFFQLRFRLPCRSFSDPLLPVYITCICIFLFRTGIVTVTIHIGIIRGRKAIRYISVLSARIQSFHCDGFFRLLRLGFYISIQNILDLIRRIFLRKHFFKFFLINSMPVSPLVSVPYKSSQIQIVLRFFIQCNLKIRFLILIYRIIVETSVCRGCVITK